MNNNVHSKPALQEAQYNESRFFIFSLQYGKIKLPTANPYMRLNDISIAEPSEMLALKNLVPQIS